MNTPETPNGGSHHAVVSRLENELAEANSKIQHLLNHCQDAECSVCAEIVCKHHEALHFHHDGCPSCEYAPTAEQIGQSWLANSSLEKWFPITAEELQMRRKVMADIVRVMGKGCGGMASEEIAPAVSVIKQSHAELYALVEAYLCTPNTSPAVEDAYDSLVAWFVRHKRPDGTEPRPVSPEQELL